MKFNQGEESVAWIDTGQTVGASPFFIRIAHKGVWC